MVEVLKRPKMIFFNFVITVLLIIGFQTWRPYIGGVFLDSLSALEDTTALLTSMTDVQKNHHFWMTLLLDYAFPLSYGAFFAGLALKFPRKIRFMLTIPACLAAGFDIIENTVQLLALKDIIGPLGAKEYLTPVKLYSFYLAALIALISIGWIGVSKIYAYGRAIKQRL